MIMKVAFIIGLAVLFNGLANVLIKLGMNTFPGGGGKALGLVQGLGWAAANPYLWAGVVSFGLALVAYAYALSRLELSFAYPVMVGLSYVVVLTVSGLLFQEAFTPAKVVGILLILAGVVLLAGSRG